MSDPTISVVTAVYGVARYLPEFLDSIARHADLTGVDVTFVDDGSPDDSARIIESWLTSHPTIQGRLLRQPNGGVASARNLGLAAATGEWVTFCDPDDVLAAGYFDALRRFLASPQADGVDLVASRFVYLDDDRGGQRRDTHPLRFRFAGGSSVRDLEREPNHIQVATNCALLRRRVLVEHGLRFPGDVRPVWEDGYLVARYLSSVPRPRIAFRADATYLYRRRGGGGDSLMQGAWSDPAKFTEVPRRGWLDALRRGAAEHGGRAPRWLQNLVLYDLMWYFRAERQYPSPTGGLPAWVSEQFFAALDEVLDYVDTDAIEEFDVFEVDVEIRTALAVHFKHADPRRDGVRLDRRDPARGLVRLRWFYCGEPPVEEYPAGAAPVFGKTRPVRFYGRTLLGERIAWVPAGAGSVRLDGVRTPVHDRTPPPVRPRLLGPDLRRRLLARLLIVAARLPGVRSRYRDAWLLMDRDTQAQDNAEHLYRFLRAEQPDRNAWFVLSRSSPDWPRLRAEGFRLIPFGGVLWRLAVLNCAHVVSSQIDNYVSAPLPAALFGTRHANTWHYTFLQHGVTKDDLSIWINPKPIDLMITATPAEQESIVSDGSPYLWTDREIRLTGFPRHDRLLRLADGPETGRPELILVMPTWRAELLRHKIGRSNDRELRDDFWDSDYALNWRAFLESEQLRAAAAAHGRQVVFVPHPNMQRYLDDSPLPPSVPVHKFAEIDVQRLLARGAVLVTDYSSLGFEMAYLQRPVVYFQFDQEEFFRGAHVYRRGYWSYREDGFGPVTTAPDDAVREVLAVLERGGAPEPEYAARMARTFPFRDGECARRSYRAIVELTGQAGTGSTPSRRCT